MSNRPWLGRGEPDESCNNCKVLQLVKKQLEQESAKGQDYREKLRDTRAELGSKERQLDVARRMLAKVNADKSTLEMTAENDRAAFRKLEAKLSVNKDAPEVQTKLAKYKHRVVELKQGLEDAEARLQMAEEANLVQSREIHVLKTALGLRGEGNAELTSLVDNHAQLLHTIAQSQEESASLALALAGKERHLSELSQALRASKSEVDRLSSVRLDMESRVEELKRDAMRAVALAEENQREAEVAKAQAKSATTGEEEALAYRARTESLLHNAEAQMAALQERNKVLTEKLQSTERSTNLSAEALKTEVAFAVERAEAATAQARADAAMGEAMLQERLTLCQQDLEQAKATIAETARARGTEASSAAAREASIREEVQSLKHSGKHHMDEADRLVGQAEQLTEMNKQLKMDLEKTREAAQDMEAHNRELSAALETERNGQAELAQHMAAMEQRLRDSLGAESARESSMQEQVFTLRSELLASSSMVDRLQAELRLARAQENELTSKYEHVDTHIEELHSTIQSLTQSKARMQSSMLEQLTSFRSQLELVADENSQLRHELTVMSQAASSRAQERCESMLQRQLNAMNDAEPYPRSGQPLFPPQSPTRHAMHTTLTSPARPARTASPGRTRATSPGRAPAASPGRQQNQAPRFRRGRQAKENDSSSSESEAPSVKKEEKAMRKNTLLNRARAASKARGYEDTDDSDDDVGVKARCPRGGVASCGCPHCKVSKDKGGARGGRSAFGSSAPQRTLLLQRPVGK